jgi:hypothetical protein
MVKSAEVILAAYDAGINFFFLTADMHWPHYEACRRGLELLLSRGGDIRDRIVVAAACYPTQPEFCSAPFSEVVNFTKGLERLDILLAGGAYAPEIDSRAEIYVKHRTRSFVGARAIGASFHDRTAAAHHACAGILDICFSRYNPAHPGAESDLFPHIANRRALLYNFKNTMGFVSPKRCEELALDKELWRPQITDYYRFALTPPEVDGVLLALEEPAQVTALAQTLERGPLEEDEREYLRCLSALDQGLADLLDASSQ